MTLLNDGKGQWQKMNSESFMTSYVRLTMKEVSGLVECRSTMESDGPNWIKAEWEHGSLYIKTTHIECEINEINKMITRRSTIRNARFSIHIRMIIERSAAPPPSDAVAVL